jgi:hypothetical protein
LIPSNRIEFSFSPNGVVFVPISNPVGLFEKCRRKGSDFYKRSETPNTSKPMRHKNNEKDVLRKLHNLTIAALANRSNGVGGSQDRANPNEANQLEKLCKTYENEKVATGRLIAQAVSLCGIDHFIPGTVQTIIR